MAHRRQESCKHEVRVEGWRRAWFDGWTEGVIWTLAATDASGNRTCPPRGRSSRSSRSECHPACIVRDTLPRSVKARLAARASSPSKPPR